MSPWTVGARRLLAASCNGCGRLRPGEEFPFRARGRSRTPALDRRCKRCQFSRMEDIRRIQVEGKS